MSHINFIATAYILAFVSLSALTLRTWLRYRLQMRELKLMEALVNKSDEA